MRANELFFIAVIASAGILSIFRCVRPVNVHCEKTLKEMEENNKEQEINVLGMNVFMEANSQG